MTQQLLIVGGGIGGFATAVAALRAGWQARLFEQAAAFTEVGAGIQLGPNATRILGAWGLMDAPSLRASRPERLVVHDGLDGRELGSLPLGAQAVARYGAPYLTVHRADLHATLQAAAEAAGARTHAARRVEDVVEREASVSVRLDEALESEGDALVGADGLWSAVRAHVVGDAVPPRSGHLAYRGLAPMADVPPPLRGATVRAWLAPRMHLVAYPVRGGEWLNVVCVVEGEAGGDPREWDHEAAVADLEHALGPVCAAARDCIRAVPAWRLWMLHDRPPVSGPDALVRGRIALLGDAAHPMRPYLAQGAGMAIEDAAELGRLLAVVDGKVLDVPTLLRRYALNRWRRVAEVQQRSRRNGVLFHADGVLRVARNAALRLAAPRLMDQPWLYAAP